MGSGTTRGRLRRTVVEPSCPRGSRDPPGRLERQISTIQRQLRTYVTNQERTGDISKWNHGVWEEEEHLGDSYGSLNSADGSNDFKELWTKLKSIVIRKYKKKAIYSENLKSGQKKLMNFREHPHGICFPP